MTDRVHPGGPSAADLAASEPLNPPPPLPPPGYVIQIPKDQIYRVPPPENAYKFKRYQSAAKRRRSRGCCCCLFYILATLLILALLIGAAAAAMDLVYRPKLPSYSVEALTITGLDVLNATSSIKAAAATPAFSPVFNAIVRASNPNGKISIDYRGGSRLRVLYSGVNLAEGSWPAFLQGTRNATAVPVAMRGVGICLSERMMLELAAAQRNRAVPLWMAVEVPVRVKFGKATTWTVVVKARCDVTVDELTAKAKVTAGTCGAVKVKVF